MVGVMVTSFKRSCAYSATPDPATGHHRPTPALETLGHSQRSLAQSLVGSLLLSPGSWHAQGFVCALQESVSQVPWMFCNKSQWPSKSNSLGILSPFAGSPDWESVVDPSTFATVWELLWYNCSPVCGLSAWSLGGIHTLRLPSLLEPEPLFPWQATADLCFCRRHSYTQRQVWLSLWEIPGSWCAQGFV